MFESLAFSRLRTARAYYYRHQITNAVTEALNGSIQALKSAARDFRSLENYRTRILFFLGRLDLHPQ